MHDEKMAETYFRQLGYVKRENGAWIEEIKATGSGFPVTVYTCPFCSYTTTDNTPYCPICGGKLGDS